MALTHYFGYRTASVQPKAHSSFRFHIIRLWCVRGISESHLTFIRRRIKKSCFSLSRSRQLLYSRYCRLPEKEVCFLKQKKNKNKNKQRKKGKEKCYIVKERVKFPDIPVKVNKLYCALKNIQEK